MFVDGSGMFGMFTVIYGTVLRFLVTWKVGFPFGALDICDTLYVV